MFLFLKKPITIMKFDNISGEFITQYISHNVIIITLWAEDLIMFWENDYIMNILLQ